MLIVPTKRGKHVENEATKEVTSDPNANSKHNESKDQENNGPCSCKLRPNTGNLIRTQIRSEGKKYERQVGRRMGFFPPKKCTNLPAMRTPCQSIVQCVEQECVVAMRTGYPAHPWNIGHRNRRRGWGGQVDNPLAIWSECRYGLNYLIKVTLLPWACNSLTATFADE